VVDSLSSEVPQTFSGSIVSVSGNGVNHAVGITQLESTLEGVILNPSAVDQTPLLETAKNVTGCDAARRYLLNTYLG